MPPKKLVKKLLPLRPLTLPAVALRTVTSKNGHGVYASSDTLFRGAVFGRDSLVVAEDLLKLKPKLVRQIILTLARLQGEATNDLNEEERGKIIHEYRTTVVDGKPIKNMPRHIFEELSSRWGGDGVSLAYYGSIDATPHYIRLIGAYCALYGRDILETTIELRSGQHISLRTSFERAVEWLQQRLADSHSGLLEYQRRNPRGIENQVWKDSKEFYVHENGERANHQAPIASIEAQGLVYDALVVAQELIPADAKIYRQLATLLRDRTIELLWDENRQYFSLGTDFSPSGKLRIIKTITANPAALLDSYFFDNLAEDKRQKYITAILNKILSREFLTDAGIRSRALSEANLIGYWDYHGSFVSWPKETYDVAKGFRRQGFPKLAVELENRIFNLVRRSRIYLEFVYVDEWGRVLASAPSASEHSKLIMIDSTNQPERVQAWTVSAVMAIVASKISSRIKRAPRVTQAAWQSDLEQSILQYIPATPLYLDRRTLNARYPSYPYRVFKDKSAQSTDMPGR